MSLPSVFAVCLIVLPIVALVECLAVSLSGSLLCLVDSPPLSSDEGERIRRRRECLRCSKRFTTYEVIEDVPIIVIKKDNL